MKLDQILIASGIGFLFFTGIYVTENARIDKISSIKNPFFQAREIQQVLEVEEGAEEEAFLTKSGEFFVLFPGSKIDMNPNKRVLEAGALFMSGSFTSENAQRIAHKNFVGPFDPDLFVPQKTQIKVAGLGISTPGANVLVVYDKGGVEVYTYEQAVEIFLPGSVEPFLMPASHKIKINEDRITSQLGDLYYTKLKKELRLEPFNMQEFIKTKKDSTSLIFSKGFDFWTDEFNTISNYAQNEPRTWARFAPDSFMGNLVSGFKFLQKHLAFGYSVARQKNHDFEAMRYDFINAYFAYLKGDKKNMDRFTNLFSEQANSVDWARFMIEYPKFSREWEVFGRSQKIWLRNILSDDIAQIFNSIWFGNIKLSSLDDFEYHFRDMEKLIFQRDFKSAHNRVSELKKSFKSIFFYEKDRVVLTRVRRLFGEILKKEPSLESTESFELYAHLVRQEMLLLEEGTSSEKVELSLENARNILIFLNRFLAQSYAEEISRVLIEVYDFLGVDAIAKEIGLDSFSKDELKTINLVRFAKEGNLSEADLEEIRSQRDILESANDFELQLKREKDKRDAALKNKNQINNKEDLIKLFKKYGIENTLNIELQEKEKASGKTLIFSQIQFSGEPFSGTFQTDLQYFSYIKVDQEESREVPPFRLRDVLKNLLRKVQKNREAERLANLPQNKIDPIEAINTSSTGKRQRRSVRTAFEFENIEASLGDIRILNRDMHDFHIKEAEFEKQYSLDFDYYKKGKDDYITQVTVESGYNKFTFGDQRFNRIGLNKLLMEAIDAQFE